MTSMDKIGAVGIQLTHEHLGIYQNIANRRVCKGFNNALNARYLANLGVCDKALNWSKDRKGLLDNLKRTINSSRKSIDDVMKECAIKEKECAIIREKEYAIRNKPCVNLTQQLKNSIFSLSNFLGLTSQSDPENELYLLKYKLQELKSERDRVIRCYCFNSDVKKISLHSLSDHIRGVMTWDFHLALAEEIE